MAQGDVEFLAVPIEVEVQLGPGVRQRRIDPQLAVQHPHAAEAVDHRLPDAGQRGGMDARVAGFHVGAHVNGGSAGEQAVSHIPVAHIVGQDAVGGQRQRGIVQGAGLVIIPVGTLDIGAELVFQQQEHNQNVSLLGNLHVGDLLLVVVAVNAAHILLILVLGQIDVLQGQIGAVLRNDQVLTGLGQIEPGQFGLPLGFQGSQTQLFIQGMVKFRPLRLELAAVLQGLANVPGRHIVGESVVVHMLFVLVGTHHVVDVEQTVGALFEAAGPEFAGVQNQLITAAVHEILVAGDLIVFPCAVGHIRSDVLLNEAGPDFGGQAGDDVGSTPHGRDLAVVDPGRFPGELCALVLVAGRLLVGAGQAQPAVLLQAPGNLGSAENEVGEDEHFGVPEGVALVALARQALGANVHPVVVHGSHDVEVILCKADGQLIEGIFGLDGHRDIVPNPGRPGAGALLQQGIIAQTADFLLTGQSLFLQGRELQTLAVAVPGGVNGGELLDGQCLAGGDGYLEFLLDDAAIHHDEALFLLGHVVHGKRESGVEHKVNARLLGGLVVLHVAALKETLVALREVLAAAVVHLAIDAAHHVQLHIAVQRGDSEFLSNEVQPVQRDKAAENQLIPLAVGGSPDHPAGGLAGLEVESAVVGLDLAGQQVEPDPVQPQIQTGNVGCIGQLGDLVVVEFVEGARHKQIPLLARIEFVGGVAQAEIAIALAHDGFTLAQILRVKAVLCDNPVGSARVIHSHKKSSL